MVGQETSGKKIAFLHRAGLSQQSATAFASKTLVISKWQTHPYFPAIYFLANLLTDLLTNPHTTVISRKFPGTSREISKRACDQAFILVRRCWAGRTQVSPSFQVIVTAVRRLIPISRKIFSFSSAHEWLSIPGCHIIRDMAISPKCVVCCTLLGPCN